MGEQVEMTRVDAFKEATSDDSDGANSKTIRYAAFSSWLRNYI